MVVVLTPTYPRFKWRSLDPHYDYGHKDDDKPAEDVTAKDNKEDKIAAKPSPSDDPNPNTSSS